MKIKSLRFDVSRTRKSMANQSFTNIKYTDMKIHKDIEK